MNYLEIDREYFKTNLTDKFRSPHLWIHEHGEWRLRHTVWDKNNSPNSSGSHGSDWKGNKR